MNLVGYTTQSITQGKGYYLLVTIERAYTVQTNEEFSPKLYSVSAWNR